jgi:ribonuclease HI
MSYAKKVLGGKLYEPGVKPVEPTKPKYSLAPPPVVERPIHIGANIDVRLLCDATLRANGEAYGGWVYYTSLGQFENHKYLGNYPNRSTYAEILALEAAIQDVIANINAKCSIHISVDYFDLPKIINGGGEFRDPDSHQAVQRIRTLLKSFTYFEVAWTKRERNRAAHRKAGKAAPEVMMVERVVYETPDGNKTERQLLVNWNKLIKMSFEEMGKLRPSPHQSDS